MAMSGSMVELPSGCVLRTTAEASISLILTLTESSCNVVNTANSELERRETE